MKMIEYIAGTFIVIVTVVLVISNIAGALREEWRESHDEDLRDWD